MSGAGNGGRGRAYEALRESEELHRATLSSISDAVFLTDDDGAYTYICPNVDVIFGYTPDEVQALGPMSTLLGERLFDQAELVAKGEIRNVERQITSKSGECRTVLVQLKRVSIRNGTVLCTCRDVTELKQAESELAAVRMELAHAARLALVGELTASIMHEVRQPLTTILANVSAGMHYAHEQAEIHEIFEEVERAATDAAEIIERQHTLVRKRSMERMPLDVNHVISDVIHLVAAEARRRGVTLQAELGSDLPAITADRLSLQQVILNLVVNAMDAVGQQADGKRQITLKTWRGREGLDIAVSDTGPGIPAEELSRLFEAFFTTKKNGIGLGLAVARSLVDAHGGRLWAANEVGGGASFTLRLPFPRAHEDVSNIERRPG